MKLPISSSLFSRFLLASLCLIISHYATSQHKVDSTNFYRKVLLNPNEDSDIEAGFAFYEKGYLKDLKNHDTLSAIEKLRIISLGQVDMGSIHESETTAIKAISLLDNLPITPATIEAKKGLYNDLARVYRSLRSFENALRYYEKGLLLCENASDSLKLINNKANVFIDMGNYELAQRELEVAYKKTQGISDSLVQARILDNLGFAQSKLDSPDGLENLLRALELRLQGQDLRGLYSSYRHLAHHYNDRSQSKEAVEYAEKAYEVAKSINSPSFIENALMNLLMIKNDPVGKEYIAINDSIDRAKLQIQNKYSAMQYNIGKEREKTEANRLLQEQEKRKKQTYQFIGLLLSMALVAYYFIQKTLNKRKVLQQIYQTETRISKKVHDEVANDVYHLMNKIQLKSLEDDSLLDDLEDIYKKTRDISKEHGELTIYEDFTEQLTDLIQSYEHKGTVITIQNISKINWKTSSDIKKTALYRVLQELMTNMRKHSQSTFVLLSFEQNKNYIQIKYRDNGLGCSLKNKNGLLNAENRMKAINGSITFDTNPQNGFKATIII